METRTRFTELDGYRGLAALAVVAYHALAAPAALGLSGGQAAGWQVAFIVPLNVAVAWFFVLSGLVVSLPFARAALGDGPVPAASVFLMRRAWRILPLYMLVFGAVWLLNSPHDTRDLVLHATMLHIFAPAYFQATVAPAWSLADEAIYYLALALFAPPLARLVARLPRRWRAIAWLAALCVPASLCLSYTAAAPLTRTAQSGPVAQFPLFTLGMGLALLIAVGVRLSPRAARLIRAGSLAAMVLVLPARLIWPALVGLGLSRASGLAFATLLASTVLLAAPCRWTARLGSRPLTLLGAWSYGLYLWHSPIQVALLQHRVLLSGAPADWWRDLALLLALALPLAALTYRLVERPALRCGRRLSSRAAPGAGTAPPILDPA